MLREVGRVLMRVVRAEDEIFRVGGEEFALIIAGGVESAARVYFGKVHGYDSQAAPGESRCGDSTPSLDLPKCAKVLTQVYQFLDNELDDASGDAIRRHLVDCEPCLDRFDVEQALKSLVNRKCGGDKAPTQLRARTNLSVTLQDERLSSVEAESRLAVRDKDWRSRKAKLDAAAAAVILQDYLDERA